MTHSLLFLALLCAGCAWGADPQGLDPVPHADQSALTERDVSVVWDAAQSWCTATAGNCCPDLRYLTVVVGTPADCAARVGRRCIGWYNDDSGTIGLVLEEIPTARLLRTVALHELGHACGLEHSADPADVMHAPATALDPSPGDVAAARLRPTH